VATDALAVSAEDFVPDRSNQRPAMPVLAHGQDLIDGVTVTPLLSERVRWINLEQRWGTQSGPNNRRLEEARGRAIACIGHDDIWLPGHLSALVAAWGRQPSAGAAADGHLAFVPGIPPRADDRPDGEPSTAGSFVPPSAWSHLVAPVRAVGGWRRRREVTQPVDMDQITRLAASGVCTAGTGQVGVCKFLGSARYLGYLAPSSALHAGGGGPVAAGPRLGPGTAATAGRPVGRPDGPGLRNRRRYRDRCARHQRPPAALGPAACRAVDGRRLTRHLPTLPPPH
jgi:hypothetical protein